ncbi:ferredoxin [Actinocorallia herbida]|uniref:Ferredoxin n=1 Tax=Actinocorallia herbida TaxID=58109 RepID=A0A3N1D166_9ACTN|nr:ferredoxin [Actinocorallia herbida]ROO87277.1 ferredoxin [Actinocorallia herbida]
MLIHVDFAKCTGLGICESLAPDFFEIDEDGRLLVPRADLTGITDAELADVRDAVVACPTAALRLAEDTSE